MDDCNKFGRDPWGKTVLKEVAMKRWDVVIRLMCEEFEYAGNVGFGKGISLHDADINEGIYFGERETRLVTSLIAEVRRLRRICGTKRSRRSQRMIDLRRQKKDRFAELETWVQNTLMHQGGAVE